MNNTKELTTNTSNQKVLIPEAIKANSGKKIREFELNDSAKIGIALLGWCKMLGVTNIPDSNEMNMVERLIILEFPDFSVDEINLAFRKAIAGKLNVSPEHYQQFSAKYIAGILNSYREFRIEEMKNYNKTLIPATTEPTEETKKQILINGLKSKFQRFEETGEFEDAGNASYDYLDSLGKIPFTTERKKEFMTQAKNEIRNEKAQQKMGKVDSNGLSAIKKYLEALESGGQKNDVVVKAKKIALKTLFKDLIETETNIDELID